MQNLRISSTPARVQVRRARLNLEIDRKLPFQTSRLQITPHRFSVQTGKSEMRISFKGVREELGFKNPVSLRQSMESKSKQKASEAVSTAVSEGDAYLNNPNPDIAIQLSKNKGNYQASVDIAAKPSGGPDISFSKSPPVKVEFQKGQSKMNYRPHMKVNANYHKPVIRLAHKGSLDIRV
jgi:hypothetical protein